MLIWHLQPNVLIMWQISSNALSPSLYKDSSFSGEWSDFWKTKFFRNLAHKHHILISGIELPGLGDQRSLEDEQKGLVFIEYDQTQNAKVH